jgi:hypothetical protein
MAPCPSSLSLEQIAVRSMKSGSPNVSNGTDRCRYHQSTKSDDDDNRGDPCMIELVDDYVATVCSCDHCRLCPLNQKSPTQNSKGNRHCRHKNDQLNEINLPPCPCHESGTSRQPYKGLGKIRFGRTYPCMVAISVLVYWIFVSLVPVYNKFFFQSTFYPYPIATAGIQLGVVSVLLAVWNAIQHFWFAQQKQTHYRRYQHRFSSQCSNTSNNSNNDIVYDKSSCCYDPESSPSSWIFGPHIWWKVTWCFPIGVLFGIKYAMTNLGLHLVPAPTHLLLQSTDLVWTVLSAWWINREDIAVIEMFCLAGCVAGSVVLGWQLNNESSATTTTPLYAIAVNLVSPILLGLCFATLRLACTELMRPDNRVGGTVSSVELTSIKLIFSSVVGLMMACLMEGGDEITDSWWVAFMDLSKSTRTGVLGGALLISVFQVNCTFLTFLTSAVGLGLVGQVKIIPQWLLAAFSSRHSSKFQFHKLNLVGAILIMGSAAVFALFNWMKTLSSTSDVALCCGQMDEEHGAIEDDCSDVTEVEGAEGKPLLLVSDVRDAFVGKNYGTRMGGAKESTIECGVDHTRMEVAPRQREKGFH